MTIFTFRNPLLINTATNIGNKHPLFIGKQCNCIYRIHVTFTRPQVYHALGFYPFCFCAFESCQFNPPLNFTRILEFNPHYKWFLIGRHFLPSKKLSFDPALVVNKYLSIYLTCLYFIRNDSRGYTFPNIYFLKYFCRNQNTLKKFNPH